MNGEEKVIGPTVTKRVKKHLKKRSLIVMLAIIILIAITVGVYLLRQSNNRKVSAAYATTVYNKTFASANQAANNNQGDPTAAIAQLNNMLTLNLSKQQRFAVLNVLGLAYLDQQKNDAALADLIASEKLEPSQVGSSTYAIMANLYSEKNDKSGAIAYYKKAIAAASNSNSYDSTSVPSYQQSIKDLGGTP